MNVKTINNEDLHFDYECKWSMPYWVDSCDYTSTFAYTTKKNAFVHQCVRPVKVAERNGREKRRKIDLEEEKKIF